VPFRSNPLTFQGKFGRALPFPLWKGKNAGEPSAHGGGKRGAGGEAPWRGVVGGGPPRNLKRWRAAPLGNPATSGTQSVGKPSAHGGGQMGVQGAEPPGGGLWGVSPHKTLKGGEQPPLGNPATSGTQNAGKPSAHGGGELGVEGAAPPPRGHGGCAPTKP